MNHAPRWINRVNHFLPALGLICAVFYLSYGAFVFWHRGIIDEYTVGESSSDYDIALVFAGDDARIEPAFELLLHRRVKGITVSPATETQFEAWAAKYLPGEKVSSTLDTLSTSTHENAFYCAEIVRQVKARRVILITSSYHMNRSHRLLTLALRGYPVEICCYPIFPHGITDETVLKRMPYYRELLRIERLNTVCNFLKFLADGLRIKSCNRFEHFLERAYGVHVKKHLQKFEQQNTLRYTPAFR